MKAMKISKRFFNLLFVTSLFIACSKDDGQDGATGPAGPQGEQGVAGTNGEDGAAGEQGSTGTANVIYSDWIQASYLNPNASPDNVMGLATLSENEFNIATDMVLVYGGNNIASDTYEIFQLAYIHNQNIVFDFGMFGSSTSSNTNLQIRVNTLDGTNNNFSYIDFYRYIIIPGGISTSGKSSIDYSKMTYNEVMAHLNILQ